MWSPTYVDEDYRAILSPVDFGFGEQFVNQPPNSTHPPETTAYPPAIDSPDLSPLVAPQEYSANETYQFAGPSHTDENGITAAGYPHVLQIPDLSPTEFPNGVPDDGAQELAIEHGVVSARPPHIDEKNATSSDETCHKRKRDPAEDDDRQPVTHSSQEQPGIRTPPAHTAWGVDPVEHADLVAPDNNPGQGQAVGGAASSIAPSPTSTYTAPITIYSCAAYRCVNCSKGYDTPSELWKHQRSHVPEDARPYPCGKPNCRKRFWFPKDVTRHWKKKHGGAGRCHFTGCGATLLEDKAANAHVSAAHRDPACARNVEIVNAYLIPLSVSTRSFSSSTSPVFSTQPTPETSMTALSRQSRRSSGIPNPRALEHITEDRDFPLFQ